MQLEKPIVIVGAGVAGLCCAQDLRQAGRPVLLVDQADAVGGRVRTDEVNGFRLDRGFQVWLEAYPECEKRLSVDVLQPGAFASGSILFDGDRLRRFPDPLRHPSLWMEGLSHPVGSLRDKLRLQLLRRELKKQSVEVLFAGTEMTTLERWQELGFSRSMMDGFLTRSSGEFFWRNRTRCPAGCLILCLRCSAGDARCFRQTESEPSRSSCFRNWRGLT